MNKLNKKGVTLFEIILVVAIIMTILIFAWSPWIRGLITSFDAQTVKNSIAWELSKIRTISFNNTTIWQELLTDDLSWPNTDASRYTRTNNGQYVVNNKSLAYYTSLYFTTKPNDPINTWMLDGPLAANLSDPNLTSIPANNHVYTLQYRQEGYQDAKKRIPNVLNFWNPDPSTSPYLLKQKSGILWQDMLKYPTGENYYLNKIIRKTDNCKDGQPLYQNLSIVFTNTNLSYSVWADGRQISPLSWQEDLFDVKFCYSQFSTEYDPWTGFALPINRQTVGQYYFETVEERGTTN